MHARGTYTVVMQGLGHFGEIDLSRKWEVDEGWEKTEEDLVGEKEGHE